MGESRNSGWDIRLSYLFVGFFNFILAFIIYSILIERIETSEKFFSLYLDIGFILCVLLSSSILFTIGYFLYVIDVWNRLRKAMRRDKDLIRSPDWDLWDKFLSNYKGYLIIFTNDGDKYLGWKRHHSFDDKQELVLCNPHQLDEKNNPIHVSRLLNKQIKSMYFFEKDIKRIAFIPQKGYDDCVEKKEDSKISFKKKILTLLLKLQFWHS